MESKQTTQRPVGFWLSAAVFAALILLVVSFTAGLGSAPHVPLLLAAVLAACVGAFHRYSWEDMLEGISAAITPALPALLIIMSIGILIATWMAGGIIPTMVYYGLQIISPRFFLVTTLLLCSLVSLAIGSSLSTIGTVGVALFGIGSAIGIPPAITVGAIVSGAYFGDKMSPLSDTTNLAPSVSDTNVFEHIRHMLVTTTPTYIICIVIYGILGFVYGGGSPDNSQVQATLDALQGNFFIHPLLLLPPLLVLVMVILRIPALPGLLGAALLGILSALFLQGASLDSVLAGVMSGFSASTGVDTVDTLLNRGGILSMMRTVALMIIALSFAGIFERTGMAAALLEKVVSHVKSQRGLVIATILTAWGVLLGTGQQYVAIIMTGRLFRPLYKQYELAPQNLSRSLEDAGTVFGGIVPYSTGAGFTENMLGISAWQYGPFTFFGWINPLIAIIIAAMGKSMPKLKVAKKES
ncbi:Na+/H+ antiporter NhaC [Acutalibacter sp. 1XD8-33]|uniref:Na+/H+ antiporter NhaC n=1 Tax=Acutalibacter sp. 1XD8-33 TaxID=2320081 RepID=UPI000EA23E09|nr:Na+/H+ antiporter NhaC [Acutalibacter sp. 1XD8-33]RKJ38765.1 Na+/H+ antiporter NhaC [Acutalibacter sp. 1XD8-33]